MSYLIILLVNWKKSMFFWEYLLNISSKNTNLLWISNRWIITISFHLTSEFIERGVWLEVKLLPVLIEGLQTLFSGLVDCQFWDYQEAFMRIAATTYLKARQTLRQCPAITENYLCETLGAFCQWLDYLKKMWWSRFKQSGVLRFKTTSGVHLHVSTLTANG